jgi:O-antigen/teichoic acid export membrane protein
LLCLVWGGHQMTQFFRSNFQAMQRFRIDSFASVFDRILLLGLVGILFLTQLDIETFVYARLLATAGSMLLFFLILNRYYGWIAPRLRPRELGKILRLSLPFALITILNSMHDKVDQVMLGELYDDHETGLYAAAYRWMDVFSMYLWTVLAIFFARFAYKLGKPKEQERLLHFGQVVVAVPMIFVCVWVFFYGEKLFWLMDESTPAELITMTESLKVLFLATLIHSLFVIYGTLLSAADQERFVNVAIVGGIAINVTLNYLFIPTYGALSAAWSTVASYGLMSLAYVVYTHFRTPIRPAYLHLLRLLGAGGILLLLFWGLTQTALPWYLSSLLAGGTYLLLLPLLGLVPLEQVRKWLQQRKSPPEDDL